MVKIDNGNILFTRKGTITVHRILQSYELQKGDKVLVKDGQRLLKHAAEPVIQRKGRPYLLGDLLREAAPHPRPPHSTAAVHRGSKRREVIAKGRGSGGGDHRLFDPSASPYREAAGTLVSTTSSWAPR